MTIFREKLMFCKVQDFGNCCKISQRLAGHVTLKNLQSFWGSFDLWGAKSSPQEPPSFCV